MSPRSVVKYHVLLHGIFKRAVRDRIISYNPCADTVVVLRASQQHSLPLYLVGFCALFVLTGVGNGSTYKMIPAIFAHKTNSFEEARRLSAALIGVAGAIGAFGGVLVNIAFRQSFLATGKADGAYISFIAFYAACLVLTYAVYLRPGRALGKI